MGRIAIVEDDDNIRTLIQDVLRMEGHTVVSASNGRAGLKLLEQHAADLVISDIFMPEQDGFELIMQMRRNFPGVKIIAMSGDQLGPQFGSLRIAQQLGAHEILHKPFRPAQLIEVVQRLLELPESSESSAGSEDSDE